MYKTKTENRNGENYSNSWKRHQKSSIPSDNRMCLSSTPSINLQKHNFIVNNKQKCMFRLLPRHDIAANQLLSTCLSVNHWWYQLLCQSWVARVWCLWTLAGRLTAATTEMNCCWNDSNPLTIQFWLFPSLFIGKVELSCCKVKCVHINQVWWHIKYTFCYQLCKVYFW